MTKPKRLARRVDEWLFDMPAGTVSHKPTGLFYWLEPLPGGALAPGRHEALEAAGMQSCGQCWLPPGSTDHRQATQIAPGDANAIGVTQWAVLAKFDALEAAFNQLLLQHGGDQALSMLARIGREAGERWIYRVQLERRRPDGRRAH